MIKIITTSSEIPIQGLCVLDCYTKWCGPCKKIAPEIETLAEQYKNTITFLKTDMDDTEVDFDISSLPTFLFFCEGKLFSTVVGANLDKIKKNIIKLLRK